MTTSTMNWFGRLLGSKKKQPLDLSTATQLQLCVFRLRQHKLAWYSIWFLAPIYLVAIFAELFAPFDPSDNWRRYTYAPPQSVSLFESTDDGWRWAPHLEFYKSKTDLRTLKRHYTLDENKKVYFEFFGKTDLYELMGFIPMSYQFIVPENKRQPFFIFGSSRRGRDMLSRLIYGARISLSVGLMGVFTTFVLGILHFPCRIIKFIFCMDFQPSLKLWRFGLLQ